MSGYVVSKAMYNELAASHAEARQLVKDLVEYLDHPKFKGDGNDFIYISTDLGPKIEEIYRALDASGLLGYTFEKVE